MSDTPKPYNAAVIAAVDATQIANEQVLTHLGEKARELLANAFTLRLAFEDDGSWFYVDAVLDPDGEPVEADEDALGELLDIAADLFPAGKLAGITRFDFELYPTDDDDDEETH